MISNNKLAIFLIIISVFCGTLMLTFLKLAQEEASSCANFKKVNINVPQKTEMIIKKIANLLFEINLVSFCILQLFLTIEIYSQILSHFSQGLNIFYFPAMN